MKCSIDILNDALALLVTQVKQVREPQWSQSSGLEGWTIADLVAHVTGSATKILQQVRAEEIRDTPSAPQDFMAQDPAVELESLADQIAHALQNADLEALRPSPAGRAPLREALRFPICDVIIHAWDVANACGRQLEIPQHLRIYIQDLVGSLPPQQLRAPGAFGPAATPGNDASPTVELMAFLGRSVMTHCQPRLSPSTNISPPGRPSGWPRHEHAPHHQSAEYP